MEDAISGAEIAPSLLALAVACLPLCLQHGEGPVCSLLALLWYSLNPLFCALELYTGTFSLSPPFFSSLSLAIPQFGLLSHVSSLRLPSGHSGPILTLSNAARASLFSPCLLVVDLASGLLLRWELPLGTWVLFINLFIYLSSQ